MHFFSLGLSLLTILPSYSFSDAPPKVCQSKYERVLMTKLRNKDTTKPEFRDASQKVGAILVNKVAECMDTTPITVTTPLQACRGEIFSRGIELLSVMRSGNALLDTFIEHFPEANVSKILIQRDEETAQPHFIYMKLSSTIASGNYVVITEPMIGTGGTLNMVISMLKDKGVHEENIIIAAVCAAPEGMQLLQNNFPGVQIVLTALDEKLNEKKYIVPGLGDFGDRYFGTNH